MRSQPNTALIAIKERRAQIERVMAAPTLMGVEKHSAKAQFVGSVLYGKNVPASDTYDYKFTRGSEGVIVRVDVAVGAEPPAVQQVMEGYKRFVHFVARV